VSQTRHRPFIERSGAGEAVLFIHGTVISGRGTWRAQRPLSARWQVQVLERRGYPPNPAVDREDFGEDAEDVKALLLAAPAHLVAHSYGAVGALLAAADAPGRVRSLTVVEPPVFGPAIGNPEVDAFVRRMDVLFREGPLDAGEFVRVFTRELGMGSLPAELPPEVLRNAPLLRRQRVPWGAEIPLVAVAQAPWPKLVISGGHHAAFDAACRELADRANASLITLTGRGHSPQQLGEEFNMLLEKSLRGESLPSAKRRS
jgi:pimeloyl-ACP methyl ester carboxylesterase